MSKRVAKVGRSPIRGVFEKQPASVVRQPTIKVLVVGDQPLVRLGIRMLVSVHDQFALCEEAASADDAV